MAIAVQPNLVHPISEAEALTPLLLDPAFCAFYAVERGTITEPVYWDVAPQLVPPWYEAACRVVPGLPAVIWLRQAPRPGDGWLVAHELEHIALRCAGFPFVWVPPPWLDALVFLTNVMEDMLIADRLAQYGFPAARWFHGRMGWVLQVLFADPGAGTPARAIYGASLYAALLWDAAYVERWSSYGIDQSFPFGNPTPVSPFGPFGPRSGAWFGTIWSHGAIHR